MNDEQPNPCLLEGMVVVHIKAKRKATGTIAGDICCIVEGDALNWDTGKLNDMTEYYEEFQEMVEEAFGVGWDLHGYSL